MKALRSSYRQRLRDKSSVIHSLEEAIAQQQTPSPDNDSKDVCLVPSFLIQTEPVHYQPWIFTKDVRLLGY